MIKDELLRLNRSPNFIKDYGDAIAALKRSGVLEVLKVLGQPLFVFDGKDINAMAAQAARSVGWNAALHALLNIESLIEEAVEPKTAPEMQYGGLDRAVKSGDILPEEAHAIRTGQPINPSIYKPKPIPTSNS